MPLAYAWGIHVGLLTYYTPRYRKLTQLFSVILRFHDAQVGLAVTPLPAEIYRGCP